MVCRNFKNTKYTNGATHTVYNITKNITVSSVKAEVGYLFHNDQGSEPISTILNNMGHTQLATPMKTYIYTTNLISNNTVHQKLSKSMDIQFY